MVFVFLCLTYVFSIVPSRYIYIVTNGTISFSLWLSHAPLCVCVCVCVCVHTMASVSIHLSTDIQVLSTFAVVNKATMSMGDACIFLS